ncbi:MAG: cytochrome c oxidase subunit II [Acidobacteriaceae bacterium]|nr:cytochrome c oxidase subunit II [Acidobacteriaceae bacterium]
MKARLAASVAPLLLFTGCAGHQQSAIDPAGPQAEHIGMLWWVFFSVLGIIFIAVMAFTLLSLMRGDREIEQEPHEAKEKKLTRIVAGVTIGTVVTLFLLLVSSIVTGKAVSELSQKNGMVIEVTGNQWWWYVRYQNDDPTKIVVTANEIHIPVGRPVMIRGTSNDVIHSFWVPNLHGKRDLIPSRVTTEWIQADKPGIYRGQCAEFCGLQHALMALWVIAEPQNKFNAWMKEQLEPAADPTDPDKERGQQVFLNNACVFCHAIRGTTAAAEIGPDLTHFGSRRSIAAGTLPNTKGNLGGWISDPQGVKPGNHMATIAVNPNELEPLLNYIESLK